MKILIVEDKKEDLYLLETLLKRNGYEVVSAANGVEALEKLRAENVDMIVSDILMPVMDGVQLCRECKGEDELNNIPFVFYTATYTDERDEELALKVGADRFIRKPLEPDELMRAIQGVIRDVREGKILPKKPALEEEKEVFKLYSERLVKKLEKKMLDLEESEKIYRDLCDNVNEMIFSLDEEGRFRAANSRTERFGYKPEDVIGRHFIEFMTPGSGEIASGYLEEMKKGEDSTSDTYEVEIIKKDGSKAIAEISMSSIYSEGKFLAAYGIAKDITEHRRTEEALGISEERLKLALEGTNDGLWDWNVPTGEVYFSPRWQTMLGYEPGEVEPHVSSWEKLVHPDDMDQVMRVLNNHLEGHTSYYEIEHRVRGKSGEWFWILDRGKVVERDPEGMPLRMVGTHTDITERKRGEETLRRSEASLAEAQHIAHLGSWDWDIVNNESYWSDEVYRIFGLKPQEIEAANKAFINFVHPDDREFVEKSASAALYENKPYGIDHRIVRPDAEVRIVREQAEVTFDESGKPIRMVGTMQDITERKLMEEELQHSLDMLRRAVNGTVQVIATTVEIRDPYTAGHQQRVADLARTIATKMGLPSEQINGIRMAGVIHDLGKISIPAEILSKPSKLIEIEFNLIKTHPQVGYDILKEVEFSWPIAQIVLQHHERMDGSGYPSGLSGEDILLEARIIAVADVVEAIASHRPYRPAFGIDKALEEISENSGILYDPVVVNACLELFLEKGFSFKEE
jgi:PAS domain S-box-containing protein